MQFSISRISNTARILWFNFAGLKARSLARDAAAKSCAGLKSSAFGSATRGTSKPTFTLKTGTIFEDSPIALEKWLPAAWMLLNCKNGISSYEIARDLGVTQKTAWFMLHRIRLAMQDENGKLGGNDGTKSSKPMKPSSAARRGTCTRIRKPRRFTDARQEAERVSYCGMFWIVRLERSVLKHVATGERRLHVHAAIRAARSRGIGTEYTDELALV